MQQAVDGKGNGVVEFVGDVFKNASTLPEDLRDLADRLNEDLISVAKNVEQEKKETAQEVEQNLRDNELRQVWGQLLDWFREPQNLFLSVVGFILFVIFIRKI